VVVVPRVAEATDIPVDFVVRIEVDEVHLESAGRGQRGADLEDDIDIVEPLEVQSQRTGQLG
jgi:hypothetical protein